MKRTLFASAAVAAALVAAPAFAGDTAGQTDLAFSMHNWDYDGGSSYDNTDVALGGAFVSSFDNGVVIQADGQANLYSWDNSSGDDALGYAAVHIAQRTDKYAIAAFGGIENYYDDAGLMLGVEGQYYFTNATLTGDVGFINFNQSNDYQLWDANVAVRYFFNDNFALDAGVGWESWDTNFTDYDGWNGTIGAEYGFDGTPASIFASYRYDAIDYSTSSFGYNVDTFTVGLRLAFGSSNLRDRTNSGASFTGAKTLSDNMLHW